jgi:drug/metabolite transporter (DMT)-like permease
VSAGLALLASLLWGGADFLAGRASRLHPAALVAFVGQAIGLLVLLVILAFHGINVDALLPGALSGAVGVIAVLAFYRALALGTMSVVAPLAASSTIIPVVVGVLGGDRPGALQCAGIAIALIGVLLASTAPREGRAPDARAALRLALVSAVGIGFALVFLGKGADHDALTTVTAARAVTVPVLGVVALATGARAPLAALPKLAGIGLLDTAANTAFAVATTTGLLSLVAILGGLFPVVTVAAAYLILHERLQPLQRAGVLLALAGIPLISA